MPKHAAAASMLVVLLASATSHAAKTIPSFAGPYILYMNRFEGCRSNDTTWRAFYGSLRVSHFNPAQPYARQTVSGSVTLPYDLNDTYWLGVEMDKRSHNEWKKNYFVSNRLPGGACSSLRFHLPDPFEKVFKPKRMTGSCVVPKGSYVVDHEPVVWNLPNFPQLPYGQYFVQITGGRKSQAEVSACADVVVTPKP